MKLFLSPHNDDETLFGAFTIQRERPVVLVAYDSHAQVNRGATWCDAATRRRESEAAMQILLGPDADVRFGSLRDDRVYTVDAVVAAIVDQIVAEERIEAMFAPAHEEGAHPQHNLLAAAATSLASTWNVPLTRYSTYTNDAIRTRTSYVVPMTPAGIMNKLRALACYESQITIVSCRAYFTESLHEYYL